MMIMKNKMSRNKYCLMNLLVAIVVVLFQQHDVNAQTKKLIDLSGYNIPVPATLVKNAASMRRRGYSGSFLKLANLWNDIFSSGPEHIYNKDEFLSNYDSLEKLKATQYT